MRRRYELVAAVAMAAVLLVIGCGDRRQCAIDGDCPLGATCATGGDCRAATCAVDRDCPLGAVCEAGACRPGCRDALDCPGDAAVCDTGGDGPGTCVGCRDSVDCPDDFSCVDHVCRQPCRDDQNCSSGHCDPDARWCVECTASSHCGAGTVCNDQRCVDGCDDDTSCPADSPRCEPDRGDHGSCVQCRGDADCAAGTCGSDGRCVAPPGPPMLDVLVVVDNSASMIASQDFLARSFPAFIEELESRLGTRPDLHIGVVSTDMGVGPFVSSTCTAVGDAGALRKPEPCLLSDGAFVRDSPLPGGLRDVNYSGSIADTFACMTALGSDGCGFEQPLAAIEAALVAGANPGFRRADAGLVVIIISNEDDCTAADPRLFSPTETGLGAYSSFRCFSQGIRCEPDAPATLGVKNSCVPRVSPYLRPVDRTVSFLRQQVAADRLVVGLIAGPADRVAVEADESAAPSLAPSCRLPALPGATPVEGDPAIRLHAFANSFGARGLTSSLCDVDGEPLRAVATAAAAIAR